MPARLDAKGPGEFIRDHLTEPSLGGRDYVGSMYQAYKEHLRAAGVTRLPCRLTFHKYVWLLKESGAIVFDGAEAVSFGQGTPQPLPPGYEPSCGTPAPRHFYRVVDSLDPAFIKPETVWRQRRGLAAPVPSSRPAARVQALPEVRPLTPAPPRVPLLAPAVIPPAQPAAVPARPPIRRRRRTVAEIAEEDARVFQPRIEALRTHPDPQELARLEDDLLAFFDRVLDTADRSRSDNRRRLLALGQRLERSAGGFDKARSALAGGDAAGYQAALDLIAGCCPQ